VLSVLKDTPLPDGVEYVPEDPALQQLPAARQISDYLYGGMPVQLGWCNGHNTKLNCLEYHRGSEYNVSAEGFVLLVARIDDIENDRVHTDAVKAFCVPPEVLVECYTTTLHYAPCHVDAEKGFRVLVALPQGTNTDKPVISPLNSVDAMLWARNKWLMAHPDAPEAAAGAYVGVDGENIDIKDLL
jgi:hypothetical protein